LPGYPFQRKRFWIDPVRPAAEMRPVAAGPPSPTAEPTRESAPEPEPPARRPDVDAELARIWRDLLGVAEVAPNDNFYALGGHSLLAVRLLARIRGAFGVDLGIRTMLHTPTFRGLSDALTSALPDAAGQVK
jgi:aryl carrier-like protein